MQIKQGNFVSTRIWTPSTSSDSVEIGKSTTRKSAAGPHVVQQTPTSGSGKGPWKSGNIERRLAGQRESFNKQGIVPVSSTRESTNDAVVALLLAEAFSVSNKRLPPPPSCTLPVIPSPVISFKPRRGEVAKEAVSLSKGGADEKSPRLAKKIKNIEKMIKQRVVLEAQYASAKQQVLQKGEQAKWWGEINDARADKLTQQGAEQLVFSQNAKYQLERLPELANLQIERLALIRTAKQSSTGPQLTEKAPTAKPVQFPSPPSKRGDGAHTKKSGHHDGPRTRRQGHIPKASVLLAALPPNPRQTEKMTVVQEAQQLVKKAEEFVADAQQGVSVGEQLLQETELHLLHAQQRVENLTQILEQGRAALPENGEGPLIGKLTRDKYALWGEAVKRKPSAEDPLQAARLRKRQEVGQRLNEAQKNVTEVKEVLAGIEENLVERQKELTAEEHRLAQANKLLALAQQ